MGNTRKARFFEEMATQASLEQANDDLTQRSKFNFSYFTGSKPGQDFHEWSAEDLAKLFGKLKEFSREPLRNWTRMPAGKSGSVLSVYGEWPKQSGFTPPKHVPHQARWARFRLDWSARLVGFVVPDSLHDTIHNCGGRFDSNTFYVVFLDANHQFWKSEPK